MLLRLQFAQSERLSGFERGQFVLQFLVFLVFAFFRLFVNSEETVKFQHRSSYAEPEHLISALGVDIDGGLVEDGWIDLRSHEALPDQLVNLELIFGQVLLYGIRMPKGRRRTNGLVRLLCALFRLVRVRRFRQIRLAIIRQHHLAHLRQCVG